MAKAGYQRGGETEGVRLYIYWFTPPMVATSRAEQGPKYLGILILSQAY